MAREWGPDRIIAVQIEDAPALGAVGAPIAVDLYAPRVMEAAFDGSLRSTSVATLRALASGDVFLVSNPRQRWLWWGLLAMAGVDVRSDPTLLLPIVAPQGPRRRIPKNPVFVAGGASWPWQNPVPGLTRVLSHLDARGTGKVVWYGGQPSGQEASWTLPNHPRLETPGWVPRDSLLKAYAGATAAIDWLVPNPERRLAFAFRHADYLGCGLPVLTHTDSPLADILGDAGWASSNIEDTLDAVLDSPDEVKRRSVRRGLARSTFSMSVRWHPFWTGFSTENATGTVRPTCSTSPTSPPTRLQHRSAPGSDGRPGTSRGKVELKRHEVAGLNKQIKRSRPPSTA